MVSYEDPNSLKIKADFVKKTGLQGIMVWELSQDNKKHELLKALADSL
jgi:chitinase